MAKIFGWGDELSEAAASWNPAERHVYLTITELTAGEKEDGLKRCVVGLDPDDAEDAGKTLIALAEACRAKNEEVKKADGKKK